MIEKFTIEEQDIIYREILELKRKWKNLIKESIIMHDLKMPYKHLQEQALKLSENICETARQEATQESYNEITHGKGIN